MKKIIIILLVVLIVIAIAIGAVVYINNNKPETSPVVVLEQGIVSYKLPNQQDYQKLTDDELEIPSGTYIKTADQSYARVFFPDNSLLSVDEKSEIQINYQGNKISIQQLIGKTWNRVQTLVEGGQYEVKTPNTIAAVRGTIFGVGVDDPDNSRVFVEEHGVEVSKYEKDKVLEQIDLGVNEQASVKRDQKSFRIIKQNTPDDFKTTLWYRRNKIVDEEYSKLRNSIRGRKLRELIKQKLIEHSDFEELRLGYRQISITEVKQQLADVDNIIKVTQNSCSMYSQDQIQHAIDQVRKYRRFLQQPDKLEAILTTLYASCSDGKINLAEAQQLQNLISDFNSTR